MALKIMCAGCGKDERERAESVVRQVLGRRAQNETWTVSLVKMAGRWSITLDAPGEGVRSKTFAAPDEMLRDSIAEAVGGQPAARAAVPSVGGPAARPAPPAPAASGTSDHTPHQCEKCRRSFVVHYEAQPDEGQDTAPVACPHCWHVNHVLMGENAAETRDYRAEKA